MNNLLPFKFNKIQLKEACWIDGKPYFTRRAIGEFLGYANPMQSITKIIERNPHIKVFSVVVKLTTTDGKEYEHEVYDPVGFQLIVFESSQPKAKSYKIAVANLVWSFLNGKLQSPPPSLVSIASLTPCVHGNGAKLIEVAKTERRFSDCVPAIYI